MSRRLDPAQRWRETAYHEAGHVALMFACGWPIVRATLIGRGLNERGRVMRAFAEVEPGERRFVEIVAVDYAGPFAERLCGGRCPWHEGTGADFREIDRAALTTAEGLGVMVDDARVKSVVRRGAEIAIRTLQVKWATVAALGAQLERKGALDSEEIYATISATWHLPGAPPVPLSELYFEEEKP